MDDSQTYQHFIDQATTTVKQAITEDHAGNTSAAIGLYVSATVLYMKALESVHDEEFKKKVKVEVAKYLQRAQDLRAIEKQHANDQANNPHIQINSHEQTQQEFSEQQHQKLQEIHQQQQHFKEQRQHLQTYWHAPPPKSPLPAHLALPTNPTHVCHVPSFLHTQSSHTLPSHTQPPHPHTPNTSPVPHTQSLYSLPVHTQPPHVPPVHSQSLSTILPSQAGHYSHQASHFTPISQVSHGSQTSPTPQASTESTGILGTLLNKVKNSKKTKQAKGPKKQKTKKGSDGESEEEEDEEAAEEEEEEDDPEGDEKVEQLVKEVQREEGKGEEDEEEEKKDEGKSTEYLKEIPTEETLKTIDKMLADEEKRVKEDLKVTNATDEKIADKIAAFGYGMGIGLKDGQEVDDETLKDLIMESRIEALSPGITSTSPPKKTKRKPKS